MTPQDKIFIAMILIQIYMMRKWAGLDTILIIIVAAIIAINIK